MVEMNSYSQGYKGKWNSPSNQDINTNECAICFQTYEDDVLEETGSDWVECVCGRWVHEDCVDYDIIVDAGGREKICPYCVL